VDNIASTRLLKTPVGVHRQREILAERN
jgi:hypothetical protein